MKMLFLDMPMLPVREWLKENNIEVKKRGMCSNEEVIALYCHNTKIQKKEYPNLKYILCPMTGLGHLNHLPKHYEVFSLDNKQWLYDNVWSTAEHTISLILRLCRGLNKELHNKIIGIVGFGRVGQQLYTLLQGFYPKKILFYDTQEIYYSDYIDNAEKVDTLELLFKYSDVISIHVSETEITKNMINSECFMSCEQQQPLIINTARASIVNYTHMMGAFNDGKIAGFGLDIDIDYFDKHHIKAWEEMKNLDKMFRGAIITPHIAGKSIESRLATDKYVFNKFIDRLGGKPYENDPR